MIDLIRSAVATARRWNSVARLGAQTQVKAIIATASGLGASGAVVSAIALVAITVVLSQGGWGFVRERVLGSVPSEVRDLPGVRAVVGVVTPTYSDAVFGLRAPLSVAVTPDGDFLYVAEGTGLRLVRKIRLSDGEAVAELAAPPDHCGQAIARLGHRRPQRPRLRRRSPPQ